MLAANALPIYLPVFTGLNALPGHVKLLSSMKMADLASPGWIILQLYQKSIAQARLCCLVL